MEEDGLLTYKGIIYIPNVAYSRRVVMDEIHQALYSGHPGYQNKIYADKNRMNREFSVGDHVYIRVKPKKSCLN